ncbi:MAG TPA: hypothetical protein VI958_02960, partial [Acidobacteriota bacterium]
MANLTTAKLKNIFSFVVSVVFVVQSTSCSTMIPGTDTTSPSIDFQIRGPGIGSITMKNPPQERWTADDGSQYLNLQPGATYNFLLLVGDRGGVARAQLQMPDTFTILRVDPPGVRNEVFG